MFFSSGGFAARCSIRLSLDSIRRLRSHSYNLAYSYIILMLAALANRVSLVRVANFFNATSFSIIFSIYNFIIFNMFSIYFLKMSPIIGLRSQNTRKQVWFLDCTCTALYIAEMANAQTVHISDKLIQHVSGGT